MIQLHPRSLLVGLVLGAIALLTMSQSPAPSTATVRVQYMPHPRDMVQVAQGSPYHVPVGKLFVVTALGFTGTGQDASLFIDGVQTIFATPMAVSGQSVIPMPTGLTAKSGSVVTVSGQTNNASAWGYLADQ